MCSKCIPQIDTANVEAFGEKLVGILNSSGLALMISVGHRTGLLDEMAEMGPATSHEIAQDANLNERYVREWLGAMVTGGIVMYDETDGTYHLPAEHAALLTRAASPDNAASTMQWVSVLGQVESEIVDCFHQGGGVHYSAFSRFHDVMADESAQTVVAALGEHILPLVPEMIDQLNAGIDVLDVGCGSGGALNSLAAQYPNSSFTGYDFSEEAIAKANAEAAARGLSNIKFVVKDVAEIGETAAYDLIFAFDAIHDQGQPAKVLTEINAALRDNGTFLMQDISSSSHLEKNMDNPIGPFLYTISTMHCMTVSLAQGGAGLGTCWGRELACEMLDDAGFDNVQVHALDHDMFNNYFIARKQ